MVFHHCYLFYLSAYGDIAESMQIAAKCDNIPLYRNIYLTSSKVDVAKQESDLFRAWCKNNSQLFVEVGSGLFAKRNFFLHHFSYLQKKNLSFLRFQIEWSFIFRNGHCQTRPNPRIKIYNNRRYDTWMKSYTSDLIETSQRV